MKLQVIKITILSFLFLIPQLLGAQPGTSQMEEIIYARKDGMALTMLHKVPEQNEKHKAIIVAISAGWTSDYNWIGMFEMLNAPISERGYHCFYVLHGSQPKYTVPDVISDIKLAVRFIRLHADEYGINPDKIGITGSSAGGHISLMMATTGDDGIPDSSNPLEKVSSRVQAAACFFPPTDFMNYFSEGDNVVLESDIPEFQAPFDFMKWDEKTKHYYPIVDIEEKTEISKNISPYYFITPDDAPCFIAHGDADILVPLSQSEKFIEKYKSIGIDCELIIKEGIGHGFWPDMKEYSILFADWFDQHL